MLLPAGGGGGGPLPRLEGAGASHVQRRFNLNQKYSLFCSGAFNHFMIAKGILKRP